jgi:tetratricopeptide (TPR) repeat protein
MRAAVLGVLVLLVPAALMAQKPVLTQESRLHYRLGWENLRHEDWEQALAEFRKSTQNDPGFALGYYGQGRALMALKRYIEAIQAYTRTRDLYRAESGRLFTNQMEAQQLRRKSADEIQEQIRLYRVGRQTPQSEDMIRQLEDRLHLLEQNQEHGANITIDVTVPPFVLLALGSAYFRAEKLEEAEREYLAALASKPNYGEVHNNLAVLYLYRNRPADALNHVRLAEKAGYRVNPELKESINEAKKKTG